MTILSCNYKPEVFHTNIDTDSLMKHPIPEARPFKESIVQKEPEAPPRYEFLIENAPKLAAQDLDIIKLTAYHVAHNGRSFLIDLATREASNFQFDFLKPSHSLYIYFGKLVDQYTRIILKSKNVVNLVESCKDKFELLELIKVRAEYTRFKKNELSDQTKKIEEDKTAFSRIDWHSFMVLDTIEFTEVDETMDFPPPISIQDLVKMSLAEKKQSSKAIHNVVDVNAPGVDDAMDMDEDVVPVSKKIRV